MLLTAIFNNLIGLIMGSFFQNVPVVEMPDGVMTVFTNLSDYIDVIGYYIPVEIALECIFVIISISFVFAIISIVLQLL
jgi:hypothetical protein